MNLRKEIIFTLLIIFLSSITNGGIIKTKKFRKISQTSIATYLKTQDKVFWIDKNNDTFFHRAARECNYKMLFHGIELVKKNDFEHFSDTGTKSVYGIMFLNNSRDKDSKTPFEILVNKCSEDNYLDDFVKVIRHIEYYREVIDVILEIKEDNIFDPMFINNDDLFFMLDEYKSELNLVEQVNASDGKTHLEYRLNKENYDLYGFITDLIISAKYNNILVKKRGSESTSESSNRLEKFFIWQQVYNKILQICNDDVLDTLLFLFGKYKSHEYIDETLDALLSETNLKNSKGILWQFNREGKNPIINRLLMGQIDSLKKIILKHYSLSDDDFYHLLLEIIEEYHDINDHKSIHHYIAKTNDTELIIRFIEKEGVYTNKKYIIKNFFINNFNSDDLTPLILIRQNYKFIDFIEYIKETMGWDEQRIIYELFKQLYWALGSDYFIYFDSNLNDMLLQYKTEDLYLLSMYIFERSKIFFSFDVCKKLIYSNLHSKINLLLLNLLHIYENDLMFKHYHMLYDLGMKGKKPSWWDYELAKEKFESITEYNFNNSLNRENFAIFILYSFPKKLERLEEENYDVNKVIKGWLKKICRMNIEYMLEYEKLAMPLMVESIVISHNFKIFLTNFFEKNFTQKKMEYFDSTDQLMTFCLLNTKIDFHKKYYDIMYTTAMHLFNNRRNECVLSHTCKADFIEDRKKFIETIFLKKYTSFLEKTKNPINIIKSINNKDLSKFLYYLLQNYNEDRISKKDLRKTIKNYVKNDLLLDNKSVKPFIKLVEAVFDEKRYEITKQTYIEWAKKRTKSQKILRVKLTPRRMLSVKSIKISSYKAKTYRHENHTN